MARRRIVGAVAIGGRVYRAGQEAALEDAAAAAGVDLNRRKFAAQFEQAEAQEAAAEPPAIAKLADHLAGISDDEVRELQKGDTRKSAQAIYRRRLEGDSA